MAKALLGHTGGPNQLLAAELHRLHQRVRELEAELARLKEEQADPADDAGHPRTVPFPDCPRVAGRPGSGPAGAAVV